MRYGKEERRMFVDRGRRVLEDDRFYSDSLEDYDEEDGADIFPNETEEEFYDHESFD